MQSRTLSAVVAVGLVAVAVALFFVLRDDDDGGDGGEPAVGTTTPAATENQQEQGKRPKPKPEIATIRVRGGEPVGGVEELEFARGDRVRFQVKSNVAEEVHVHGYDLSENVAPGNVARFNFPAEIEGGFEVELEGTHTQIAELRVEPR